jgi:ADP-ribose pyrophosphatase YjhB (NUDIX family)/chloramphenicol 3-O-phosphotransferase
MPRIRVALVVTTEDGVLLVREDGAEAWSLPGGPLLDTDETIEEVALREVERLIGERPEQEPEFLETLYERHAAGEVTLHNLYHLPIASSALFGAYVDELAHLPNARATSLGSYTDWLYRQPTDLDTLPPPPLLPDWLRDGLLALFNDEPLVPDFELAAIQTALAHFKTAAPVFLICGPAGAGKSSVARGLCARFERSAHIDADRLRQMVQSGYVPAGAEPGDPDERLRQLALARLNAAAVARNFSTAGFTAVIDDVLEAPEDLDDYLDALGMGADVHVVTLLPDAPTLAARDAQRPDGDRMGARAEDLRRTIDENGETRGLRLDTSLWSVAETVDVILERMGEARVIEEMGA